jgi:hypothetical protein
LVCFVEPQRSLGQRAANPTQQLRVEPIWHIP